MTKKQLAALQRILDREEAAYQVLSGRPSPGQHPSQGKFAISDGDRYMCFIEYAISRFEIGWAGRFPCPNRSERTKG